jgi:hypothetical protein
MSLRRRSDSLRISAIASERSMVSVIFRGRHGSTSPILSASKVNPTINSLMGLVTTMRLHSSSDLREGDVKAASFLKVESVTYSP